MEQFTEQLVNIAFKSFIQRKTAALEKPSRLLIGLSAPYDAIGKYFLGIWLTRSGEHIQALNLLEQAALSAPPAYRARAIACMASMANSEGDLDSARILAEEARKAAVWSGGRDDFTRLGSGQVLAINRARRGDSRAALRDFLDLLPETAQLSESYEPLYLNLLNSIAVEFMAIGRLDDATKLSAKTIRSPYCWHEWRDTWIELKARRENPGVREVPSLLSQTARGAAKLNERQPGKTDACKPLRAGRPEKSQQKRRDALANQTRRGKLEVIAELLRQELSTPQSDTIIDLLDGLWFHTGTCT
jgi:tetratricopeptide (TPR) repeat protein